ncbi:ghrelin O-acyltransferase isoform X2 [Tupaia chinensis]|uniref:ghrelin O-acyltransferase isoform X2 n=1 Tax=Tupaia chinensis TaxID=246437 RepID=UPI000FFBB480|nr:ghrelin O-acyltransferase isoform X2 [Tupaia chinensis]
MGWHQLLPLYPLTLCQAAALPFALLFRSLCTLDAFSTHARHLFLLAGGGMLAWAAMGCHAVLVFIPAVCAVVLILSLSAQDVHRWVFLFQMGWQSLCHLGLHYTEHYLQQPPPRRFCTALSALMLLTQRVTSLSLDICEGKVATAGPRSRSSWSGNLGEALTYLSYLLFFPALLGGPLCSFQTFQARVCNGSPAGPGHAARALAWPGLQLLSLEGLKVAVRVLLGASPGLAGCRQLECVLVVWATAGFFKLTYYSHWTLDAALLQAAGFEPVCEEQGPDADIWTLETAHRISVFTRAWNRSTARWLRRLVFQRSARWRRALTFAFSAWWHGLHPGQALGFLCWAVAVEADHLVHAYARKWASSGPPRLLCRVLGWVHTQLTTAYILLAVQAHCPTTLWQLCTSCGIVFPLAHCLVLLLFAKGKRKWD